MRLKLIAHTTGKEEVPWETHSDNDSYTNISEQLENYVSLEIKEKDIFVASNFWKEHYPQISATFEAQKI